MPLHAGPYRCATVLGSGGTSQVYAAVNERETDAPACAVKVLDVGADDAIARLRFDREREVQSTLRHRHIVRVFDSGVLQDDRPWMAMELVRGPALATYLRQSPADLPARLNLFAQIAQAIEAAHEAGWVHRDLKPSNVLLDESGCAKLIDFGLAKRVDRPSQGVARTFERFHGVTLTPAYAAPEQLRHASASQRSIDVHALGVLLYEMLTGIQPFEQAAREGMSIASAVCDWSPPRPSSVATALWGTGVVDADLDDIVLHALAKLASDRPPTAVALAQRVEAWRLQRSAPQRQGALSHWWRRLSAR